MRHLCLDLREGRVGVVVELQVHGDGAGALRARRFEIINAVSAGDHALQWRGDESTHQIGVGPNVSGGDADDGNVAARILTHRERADRLQPRDQDDQTDYDGENGSLDEQIGQFHQRSSTFGDGSLDGWILLLT